MSDRELRAGLRALKNGGMATLGDEELLAFYRAFKTEASQRGLLKRKRKRRRRKPAAINNEAREALALAAAQQGARQALGLVGAQLAARLLEKILPPFPGFPFGQAEPPPA